MIREQDLRIDIYRSGAVWLTGAAPDSAIRVTHLPSGLVATRLGPSMFLARDEAIQELEERLADRYCPWHYDPDALINFPRWMGACPQCVEEEHQAWVADVQSRLEFALAQAAHGQTVTWRPRIDAPEAIVARMMELRKAPATFAETVAWVRKYLGGDQ